MEETKEIKLNIGGGPKRIEGFKNVDALEWDGATDIIQDLIKVPWEIGTNSVDEILMEECLEHISFRHIAAVLCECRRIMKPNAKIKIQVPDCGKAMEYYVNKQICECCAHKPKDDKDAMADPKCFACGGKAKIHPNRWLFGFIGAQKHKYDTHRMIFDKDTLEIQLKVLGFREVEVGSDKYGWKLIAEACK